MKKTLLLSWLILSQIFHPAWADEVSRIRERGTERELVYTKTASQLIFSLIENDQEKVLKIMEYKIDGENLQIAHGKKMYRFKTVKGIAEKSLSGYEWCWSDSVYNIKPALWGALLVGVGVVVSAGLCAVVPGVPMIVAVLVAPFDGIITAGHEVFNQENIMARKFARLLRGKDRRASSEVFELLIQKIRDS